MPADEIDTRNKWLVGANSNGVVIMKPPRGPLTRMEALTFAAWLVLMAGAIESGTGWHHARGIPTNRKGGNERMKYRLHFGIGLFSQNDTGSFTSTGISESIELKGLTFLQVCYILGGLQFLAEQSKEGTE